MTGPEPRELHNVRTIACRNKSGSRVRPVMATLRTGFYMYRPQIIAMLVNSLRTNVLLRGNMLRAFSLCIPSKMLVLLSENKSQLWPLLQQNRQTPLQNTLISAGLEKKYEVIVGCDVLKTY